jgi:hypothetical protein
VVAKLVFSFPQALAVLRVIPALIAALRAYSGVSRYWNVGLPSYGRLGQASRLRHRNCRSLKDTAIPSFMPIALPISPAGNG